MLFRGAVCLAFGLVVDGFAPAAPAAQALTSLSAKNGLKVQMDSFIQRQWADKDTDRPFFEPGDTVAVGCEIVEGSTKRIQVYQGIVIGRSGEGFTETFTVRKMASGVGVERVFPLYAPLIKSLTIVRRGSLSGKASRIPEKKRGLAYVMKQEEAKEAAKEAAKEVAAAAAAATAAAAVAEAPAEEMA
ncbi:translation protein SH3-like domain-containing protein [Pelagophyceae sp. CCMP2097]|nr:translation protein SH3-like domain-containing protein [Pelagophyceae sp. CCMP2097]